MEELFFENFKYIFLGFIVLFIAMQFYVYHVVSSSYREIKISKESVKGKVTNIYTMNERKKFSYEFTDYRGRKQKSQTALYNLGNINIGDEIDIVYSTNMPKISMPNAHINSQNSFSIFIKFFILLDIVLMLVFWVII